MNYRAKASSLRFPARRRDLLLAHSSPAAVAHALGGENFDDVGLIHSNFADVIANLRWRKTSVIERPQRGDNPRPRHHATIDRVARIAVDRAAEALDRRESGHQSDISIFEGVAERGDLRIVARLITSVRTEMPGDVHMR